MYAVYVATSVDDKSENGFRIGITQLTKATKRGNWEALLESQPDSLTVSNIE